GLPPPSRRASSRPNRILPYVWKRISFLPHVNAQPSRRGESDRDRVPLLAEVWMSKDDFMRSDRHGKVANRRLADFRAVDPHVSPWSGVQRNRPIGEFELDRGHLVRSHLYVPRNAIAERLIDDL